MYIKKSSLFYKIYNILHNFTYKKAHSQSHKFLYVKLLENKNDSLSFTSNIG